MSDGNWAEISECGTWRYGLGRQWSSGPVLGWIMLNPSTADARVNDQSIAKIMTISGLAGYGSAWVANLYGLRSPSPAVLRARPDRIGPENDTWLRAMLAAVPKVVLAWGANGGQPWAVSRRDTVLAMVAASGIPAACLGRTREGEPRHPCRLANATQLEALS